MRFPTFCRILSSTLSLALIGNALAAQSPLGVFEAESDVGRVGKSGFASYDSQRQAYRVVGSGQNMWGDHDDFHFVWKRMTGNFILSTRAGFIGAGGDAHRKIGWTIRSSLETSSPHVSAALHGNGLMSLQFRRTPGAMTEEAKSRDSLPNADAVIQLERRDGVYVMSVAQFGDTLATQELTGVSLPDTVYVGMFVCSHNDAVVERGAFSNVRITTPAKADLVPYRDYLGSNLEILDVATGNATIVHRYRGSFQAPNWTVDGKALIYAQEGKLYRFDLASRAPAVINTGFATRNNNDHVLSFDGRMVAISHHAVEDSGASIVYTVAATGGTPKRVTSKGPSYLHGWSPDGRWLRAGIGRRPRVHARWRLHLLQLGARRTDADLAHATRWERAGTDHEGRLQQLVPAHFARRQVDRVHLLSPRCSGRRSSILQARAASIDAHRRRAVAGDRLCVRRPGDDQRAVVVAGWKATRVREQLDDALVTGNYVG
jgi:hypothetical protein